MGPLASVGITSCSGRCATSRSGPLAARGCKGTSRVSRPMVIAQSMRRELLAAGAAVMTTSADPTTILNAILGGEAAAAEPHTPAGAGGLVRLVGHPGLCIVSMRGRGPRAVDGSMLLACTLASTHAPCARRVWAAHPAERPGLQGIVEVPWHRVHQSPQRIAGPQGRARKSQHPGYHHGTPCGRSPPRACQSPHPHSV